MDADESRGARIEQIRLEGELTMLLGPAALLRRAGNRWQIVLRGETFEGDDLGELIRQLREGRK